jgi:putative ABC transport system permease protein
MRRAWCRLQAMVRRVLDGGARDEELSEEIRAFVEHDAESKIKSGMTPGDARRAALIELGGVEQVKERVREDRAGARWESVFWDIRYAIRSLAQARGFSSSVIGSLSLGLAATIVAFAFVNGALLRPFPGVRDQDRVVTLGILENTPLGPRIPSTALADYPDAFRALGEGMTSLEDLASFTESDVAVTLPQPRSLPAAFVSPNYFEVLGVRPEIGRTFAPEKGRVESAVAIIGHALWTREFGRDPSVAGRPIQVGGQSFQVVGVAPQGFRGTTQNPVQTGVELWLPIALADRVGDPLSFGRGGLVFVDEQPGERVIRYVGRMRDGVRPDRVETELAVMARRVVTPADGRAAPVMAQVSSLSRLNDRTDAGQIVAIILSIPLLVLVIACVNAANLFLVRASRRRREMVVRLALGASRLRLVRQLVIESLVLAIGAVVLALPLAWWGLQWVAAFMTIPMPLDGTVAAGALVTAFLTALGFGLVPALQAAGQHPSAALGTSPAGSGGTRSESRGRRALVAGQVALSLGLLATGFQLTSALESLAEPPGTAPDRLLLASFNLAQLRFSSAESDAFHASLLERISRLPGVEAAGLSSRNLGGSWTFDPANAVVLDAGDGPVGGFAVSGSASGDYFKAVGLDLVQGREFVEADRRELPDVAIVTQRLASQILKDVALGRSLRVSTPFRGAAKADVRIVGIVESPVGLSGEEVAAIFFPSPFPSPIQRGTARTLHVRSEGPAATLAPAIRDLVAQLDPRVPILELATLDQKIRADFLQQRMLARGAALLGIVALLLASVGLYGVTSYSVAMRGREIAVRMALGARADIIVAMVLRQALAVAVIGSVLGGLVAIVAGLLIQAEVFGVAGIDVATLGGSAVLLAVAMLLASILPAWRAARLDPNAVLREE